MPKPLRISAILPNFALAVRVVGNAEVRPMSVSGQGSSRTSEKGCPFQLESPLYFSFENRH